MQEAINKINELIDFYSISEIDDELLNLLIAAMNSKEANHWDENRRSDIVFFYKAVIGSLRAIYDVAPSLQQMLLLTPKDNITSLKTKYKKGY